MLYGIGDPPLRLDGAGGPRGLSMVSPGFLRMRGAAASGSAAMRDRTRELHQGSDSDSEGEGPGGEGRLLGPQDPALAQARRVRSLLAALSRSAAELEQLQERALGTPLPPPELQEELQRLRDEIQDLTREIQGGLRALAPAPEEAPNSIGARLRRTQHGLLAQQFWGLTGTLQAAQGRYPPAQPAEDPAAAADRRAGAAVGGGAGGDAGVGPEPDLRQPRPVPALRPRPGRGRAAAPGAAAPRARPPRAGRALPAAQRHRRGPG
ncbi:syntaxin-4-like isoform X2 [Zonotrichia albicollis]|uniref:syntaxin-4-like isoform X2 n=1 Tax=Zonotrichia albicollis TaxID=44394 RepID=UPI003D80DB8B